MILADLQSLPNSASSGPETWGEAFGRAVDATDQVMMTVENVTATQDNFRAAYQSYIDDVEAATGQKLENPMNIDVQTGTFQPKANPTYGFESGNEWRDERARVAMERFDAQRAALAEQYPAQARLISLDIDGRVKKRMQDAEAASRDALSSPELGAVGRISAQMLGGIKGSARDPYQWAMSAVGGGSGVGRTMVTRIGRAVLTEALLNGGQEAVLQSVSQERKKRAGLEYGMENALKNVGIATVFGGLFGGGMQGGGEVLARVFRLGDGGAERAARVLAGNPERGDVEALAKAMNVELSPEKLDLLNRSFEERILDEVTISPDASPDQLKVLDAAMRHAEDPDNFPPPDVVERLLADEQSGRTSTLSADQYERAYGGDANAIDDIRDTFFADDLERAAGKIDEISGSPAKAAGAAESAAISPEPVQRIAPERVAEPLDDPAMRFAEEQAGEILEPEIDANGNPKTLFDFIAAEDGDGNVRLVSAAEALRQADEPALLADLLEACKL